MFSYGKKIAGKEFSSNCRTRFRQIGKDKFKENIYFYGDEMDGRGVIILKHVSARFFRS